MCFPVNFVKFLRTPFFKEYLRRLLLDQFKSSVVKLGPWISSKTQKESASPMGWTDLFSYQKTLAEKE